MEFIVHSRAMVLKLKHVSESLEGSWKPGFLDPTLRASDSVDLGGAKNEHFAQVHRYC